MSGARSALGAGAGLVADRLLGEPPAPVHPVALCGSALTALERHLYADDRVHGAALAGAASAAAVLVGVTLQRSLGPVAATAAAVGLSAAGRMLADVASEVGDALTAGDLEAARALLPSLVGRDPTDLDAAQMARAVVESVAENTVDAVVAPALWGTVAGAPGVLVHRVANTLDAMVGHRSERYRRFGWASARLDDLLAWVPARLTAALVAAVRPGQAGAVWQVVRRDAPGHPSPNAGVAEAAFAAALGLRLGGVNRYDHGVEQRPEMGDGRPPRPEDVPAAVRLSLDVGAALTLGLAAVGAVGTGRTRRSIRPTPT